MSRWSTGASRRQPVGVFIGGSLVILFVCLVLAAAYLVGGFLEKEEKRVDVARRQLLAAFAVQLTELSSEMWTESYEAMGLRVSGIAERFGRVPFEVFVLDPDLVCVYSNASPCRVPPLALVQIQSRPAPTQEHPALAFDGGDARYSYAVPLGVGSTLKGYLVARLGDPYDFYRGGFWGVFWEKLIPLLIGLLVVWSTWLGVSYRWLLKPYFREVAVREREEALMNQARQLAHDIRNPVAALDKLLATLPADSAPMLPLMRQATSQIRDIANNLLARPEEQAVGAQRVESLDRLIRTVVSQCRVRWRGHRVRLEYRDSPQALYAFSHLSAPQFKRALANLIDNAFEATDGPRSRVIRVGLTVVDSWVKVEVVDEGKGIPQDRISQLGRPGATFGKRGGHGLGLAQAREMVGAASGELGLQSTEGAGTTVTLRFPLGPSPSWFLPRLTIPVGGTVVLLDDDAAYHELWRVRVSLVEGVRFHAFSDLEEGLRFLREHSVDLLLCDYDLGNRLNGLEVLEMVTVGQSVLTTQLADEVSVQDRCAALGIALVPKDWLELLGVVPGPAVSPSREKVET